MDALKKQESVKELLYNTRDHTIIAVLVSRDKINSIIERLSSGKTIENVWTSKLNSLESIKLISKIARSVEKNIELGVDMAASEYFKNGYYFLTKRS